MLKGMIALTLDAITKYLKPAVTNQTLFYFSTTALKSVYASQASNFQFDDASEIVTWTDEQYGVEYAMDYADINVVVTNPNKKDIPMTLY